MRVGGRRIPWAYIPLAIVVLAAIGQSCSGNGDGGSGDTSGGGLSDVPAGCTAVDAAVSPEKFELLTSPVRLFAIAYGEGADLNVLERMAEATNAKAYDASDPATIDNVFTNVVSNF